MAPRMIPSKASMRSLFQAGKRTKQVQANEKKCEAPSASFRSFSPTGPVFNSFIDRIGMDDDDQYKGKEAEVIELTQVWLTISERSKFNVDVRKTNFSRSSHNHVNPAGLTVRARRISQDGSLGEAISVWTSNLYDPDVTHYDFLCKAEKDILAKLKEFTGSDWIPAPKVPSAAASPAEGDEQQDKRSTIITTSARSGRASLPPSASSAYDVPVVAQRGAGAAAGAMAEEHLLTKAIKDTIKTHLLLSRGLVVPAFVALRAVDAGYVGQVAAMVEGEAETWASAPAATRSGALQELLGLLEGLL